MVCDYEVNGNIGGGAAKEFWFIPDTFVPFKSH